MSAATSSWIPSRRIHIAIGLAFSFAVVGVLGAMWSRLALIMLAPSLGAGWAAFVMMRIRSQLSASGGDWQHRIHDLVLDRLALPVTSTASVLDIGCGDASLLVNLLNRAPQALATGVDYWGEHWDYAQAACEERVAEANLKTTFRRNDAAHLEFDDETFDVVVSVMCFHEVRAPAGASLRGPLLAVREALRVLRPGGTFVLVDRFASKEDYGDPAELAALFSEAVDLRRDPIVAALGVPWPLNGKRALGPVEVLSGRKPGR